jgi:hypothetical protein
LKTIDTLLARSVPVRTYYAREIAEELSKLCDETGCSFSTIVNAAVKVALQNSEEIVNDARGVQERQWQNARNT